MPPAPLPFDLDESSSRLGSYAWVETRLFEIVGGWVATVSDPGLRVRFSAESHHFGWHAELWQQLVPPVPGRDPNDLVVAPNAQVEAVLDELADAVDPARGLEKAVGLYRVVLPRQVAIYADHLERTVPVSDGPVRRWLRIVIDDHLHDWRAGEQLVQRLLVGAGEVERAAGHQAHLEAMLVRAGGLVPEQEGIVDGH